MSNSKYYDILRVSKQSTKAQIKKAYHKMAIKYHPDRNPNNKEECEEKFKEVSNAYRILSDENLRKRYDQFGEAGIKNDGGPPGGFNPFDLFSNIFGGGGGPFGGNGPFGGGFSPFNVSAQHMSRKSKSALKEINVSLKDLYTGKSEVLKINKNVKCDICKGIGCVDPNDKIKCNICDGKGKILQVARLGPGMIQQIVKPCYNCKSKGKIIRQGQQCSKCGGDCLVRVSKNLDFYIHPGTKDGDKVVLYGEASDDPDYPETGDLILKINQTGAQNGMTREGNNLVYKKEISLSEALCGLEFVIKHLDDRKILLKTDKIINPNTVMKLSNEGMPIRNQDLTYGDLIIRFVINFPFRLNNERKKFLRRILPKTKKQIWDIELKEGEDHEIRQMELLDEDYQYNPAQDVDLGDEFEDDDSKFAGNPIECATQ